MWKYKKETITIEDPTDDLIIIELNKFGEDDWEVFSILGNIIYEWEVYSEKHYIVEYTIYMKKKFN